MPNEQGRLLVVDDNEDNRDVLSRRLVRQGHTVQTAENGRHALEMMRSHPFDLVLLDIMMPEMNGYQVLEEVKADGALRHIPIIVISAVDDIESTIKCIQLGAEDYLPKPFNPVLLKARINASLEKKRLRDQEQDYLRLLQAEQERSERLLLNILPKPIADRLKEEQDLPKEAQSTIADSFAEATVMFADIVDFTQLSARVVPTRLVEMLNQIFSTFDRLAETHGLEKIKTIGDAYMAVGGLPTPRPDHAKATAEMALAMREAITQFATDEGEPFDIRIGINSGPVVAGVIGTKKFVYDLWGDTVNIASRMESQGLPGGIQVTEETYKRLQDHYLFEERGVVDIKGKGFMTTYFLTGRKNNSH